MSLSRDEKANRLEALRAKLQKNTTASSFSSSKEADMLRHSIGYISSRGLGEELHPALSGASTQKAQKVSPGNDISSPSNRIMKTLEAINKPPSHGQVGLYQGAQDKQAEVVNPYLMTPDESEITVKMKKNPKLKFNQKGKYISAANLARKQIQLEQLRSKIDEELKKKGLEVTIISDALVRKDAVPKIEWWDQPYVKSGTLDVLVQPNATQNQPLRWDLVTKYIYHPEIVPPSIEVKPVKPRPLMLTKKEQKKLRRQRRLQELQTKREQISLGLAPQEPQKLKMSNYMKVLGNEALENPTQAESMVRAQIAQRQSAHETQNTARQLTDEERRAKKKLKLAKEFYNSPDGILQVYAYRITDLLRNGGWGIKIRTNASQLHIVGCALLHKQQNLVIVEGSSRSIRKFHRLMTDRIKWNASDEINDLDNLEEDNAESPAPETRPKNECILVWKGITNKNRFPKFEWLPVESEMMAVDYLKQHGGLDHLWKYARSLDSIADADFMGAEVPFLDQQEEEVNDINMNILA